jgi:hypothetical protein
MPIPVPPTCNYSRTHSTHRWCWQQNVQKRPGLPTWPTLSSEAPRGEARASCFILAARYKVVMAASIEELSYQLTSDALAERERALSGLRSRAGTVVATASISGSFLGTKANHGSLDVWAILALGAFVLCLASAIWILLPHKLVFAFRGDALLAESDHRGVQDVTEAYRAAGIWIEPNLDSNRDRIANLSSWFTVSCGLLAIEVILWTISVAG